MTHSPVTESALGILDDRSAIEAPAGQLKFLRAASVCRAQVHARPQPDLLPGSGQYRYLKRTLFGVVPSTAIAVEDVCRPVAARREVEFAIPRSAPMTREQLKAGAFPEFVPATRLADRGQQAYRLQVTAQLEFHGKSA